MSEQINFHQLIDLAFGSPKQEGILNVKYLQALMHGLVHRLEFDNVKVELKCGEFAKADELINALGPKPTIEVFEFETQKIDCNGKYEKKKQKYKKEKVCIDTVMVLKDMNKKSDVTGPNATVLYDQCMKMKAKCNEVSIKGKIIPF